VFFIAGNDTPPPPRSVYILLRHTFLSISIVVRDHETLLLLPWTFWKKDKTKRTKLFTTKKERRGEEDGTQPVGVSDHKSSRGLLIDALTQKQMDQSTLHFSI